MIRLHKISVNKLIKNFICKSQIVKQEKNNYLAKTQYFPQIIIIKNTQINNYKLFIINFPTNLEMQKQSNPESTHQQSESKDQSKEVKISYVDVKEQQKMKERHLVPKTQTQDNITLSKLQKQIQQLTEQIRVLLSSQSQNQIQINGRIKVLLKLQTKFHSIKELYLEQPNVQSNSKQSQNNKQSSNNTNIQNNQNLSTSKQTISNITTNNSKQQQLQAKIQQIQKQTQLYEPSMEEITEKKELMLEEMNEDGWTDATQSENGTLGEDGIMVLDDDMLDQLIGKMQDNESQQNQNLQQSQDKIDYEQLEQQFITGQESNQDFLFGKHGDKFCVSVCSLIKEGIVVSGGGDDRLHLYKFDVNSKDNVKDVKQQSKEVNKQLQEVKQQSKETKKQSQEVKQQSKQLKQSVKQQNSNNQQFKLQTTTELAKQEPKQQQINIRTPQHLNQPKLPSTQSLLSPFKIIPHHQTIDKLQLSFDKQNLFSLTTKQLMCTNLKTFQTTKLQISPPTQLTCHKQGGVFAIGNQFNVEIYNINGFKFYDSYCLDEEVNILKWTLNGKQLVAACDNKLRIIAPKTQQITKVTGTAFHDGEITCMSLSETTVFTGCIDGFIFASNLSKGQIIGSIPKLQETINTLYAADNLLIVGPAANTIYWYDSNKLKQLFSNELKGSSTDIIQLANKNQYAVSDIQGEIRLFDKRAPMQEKFILKAGNTVHQLWYEDSMLLAACEDGCARGWDLRKYKI